MVYYKENGNVEISESDCKYLKRKTNYSPREIIGKIKEERITENDYIKAFFIS